MRGRKIFGFLLTVIAVSVVVLFLKGAIRQDPFLEDLNFIESTIKNNHPGFVNEYDKKFHTILENGAQKAKFEIRTAKFDSEKMAALERFLAKFGDPNLSLSWNIQHPFFGFFNTNFDYVIDKEVAFVRLPTFVLHGKNISYSNLLKILPTFRNCKAVVFDLRGNNGGNVACVQQILEAFFLKEKVQEISSKFWRNLRYEWRVSRGNLAYLEKSYHELKKNSSLIGELELPWYEKVISGMKTSLKSGQNFFRDESFFGNFSGVEKAVPNLKSDFSAHIIVIIDEKVGSVAVHFLNLLSLLTNDLILIGHKANFYNAYFDVRFVKLPKTGGFFGFPMSVCKGNFMSGNWRMKPTLEIDLNDEEFVHEAIWAVVNHGGFEDVKAMQKSYKSAKIGNICRF